MFDEIKMVGEIFVGEGTKTGLSMAWAAPISTRVPSVSRRSIQANTTSASATSARQVSASPRTHSRGDRLRSGPHRRTCQPPARSGRRARAFAQLKISPRHCASVSPSSGSLGSVAPSSKITPGGVNADAIGRSGRNEKLRLPTFTELEARALRLSERVDHPRWRAPRRTQDADRASTTAVSGNEADASAKGALNDSHYLEGALRTLVKMVRALDRRGSDGENAPAARRLTQCRKQRDGFGGGLLRRFHLNVGLQFGQEEIRQISRAVEVKTLGFVFEDNAGGVESYRVARFQTAPETMPPVFRLDRAHAGP